MLTERHLLAGLDALSRAHEANYFLDGHKGGAIISAYYLCRDEVVEPGAVRIISGLVEDEWLGSDLCAPMPAEDADPALLGDVVAALRSNLGPLRQAGHNIILPTLALKAFAELPEAVTPSRVAGVCRLVECFDSADEVSDDDLEELPGPDAPEALAEFILAEFLRCMSAFEGRGQGWSGHMLTCGRAVVELAELGYEDLAGEAAQTFRHYIARTRMGPLETDKPRAEHAASPLRPLEAEYWRRRPPESVSLGHCFKYPYGFYGLMHLAGDGELRQRCLAEAFRVL